MHKGNWLSCRRLNCCARSDHNLCLIDLLAMAANWAWGFPVAKRSAAAKISRVFLKR